MITKMIGDLLFGKQRDKAKAAKQPGGERVEIKPDDIPGLVVNILHERELDGARVTWRIENIGLPDAIHILSNLDGGNPKPLPEQWCSKVRKTAEPDKPEAKPPHTRSKATSIHIFVSNGQPCIDIVDSEGRCGLVISAAEWFDCERKIREYGLKPPYDA